MSSAQKSYSDMAPIPAPAASRLESSLFQPTYRPHLQVSPSRIVHYQSSSGRNGPRSVMAYTRNDLELLGQLAARTFRPMMGHVSSWSCYNGFGHDIFGGGLTAEAAVVNKALNGTSFFSAGLAFEQASRWRVKHFAPPLTFSPTPITHQSLSYDVLCEHRELIIQSRPSIFLGPPLLAFALFEMGALQQFEAIVIGGESSSSSLRKLLSMNNSRPVVEVYGLSKALGPGVAQSCKHGTLHLNEDIYDTQVHAGELILSSRSIEGTLLDNHATGDIARSIQCDCGNPYKAIEVVGRRDEKIEALDCYPSELQEQLLQHGLAPIFRVTETEVFAEYLNGQKSQQLPQLNLPVRVTPQYNLDRTLFSRTTATSPE